MIALAQESLYLCLRFCFGELFCGFFFAACKPARDLTAHLFPAHSILSQDMFSDGFQIDL